MVLSSKNFGKWPSWKQWQQFFKILKRGEKILFFIFLILASCSFIFLLITFYFENTQIKPASDGIYIEGLVGSPRFINPIYAQARDVDRDLTELIFSGLMKYNSKGEIVKDLAESFEPKDEGKIFEIYLKENITWHDGKPLSTEDVIFTIKTIQDSDFKSPLRAAWLGVEIEKISDLAIRFKLKNPSASFLENLTLKILPKHIWEGISSENFPLSEYNLRPIGSGPYKFKDLKVEKEKIISLDLIKNQNYHSKIPYLDQITFYFFESEEELIKNLIKIKGFSPISFKNSKNERFENYFIPLPRYFAIFFNLEKTKIFAEKEVRQALNYGTNKSEILERVIENQGQIVNSPILPEIFNLNPPAKIYEFNLEKAKEILNKAGFLENEQGLREKIIKKEREFEFKNDLKLGSRGEEVRKLQECLAKDPEIYPGGEITGFFGNSTKKAVIKFQEKYKKEVLEPGGFKEGTGMVGEATRRKLNEICFPEIRETLSLKFSLATADQSILIETAEILKDQWKNLGIEVEIKKFDRPTLEREIIKKRDYEALLFGQVLPLILDPFPFWHSSQKIDPGLNLALYENETVNKLLEQAREILNSEERAKKYQEFQDILIEEAPAIFLFSPDYPYFISKEIKGVNLEKIANPAKRFSEIEEWFIKTRRAWK